jgi:sigma-B regulation protein RsbU (phosphoserine phosphatase)
MTNPQKQSPEHLLTLYQITGTMNSSLDLDAAMNNIIDAVMNVTRAQRGFLLSVDEGGGPLRVLTARGADGSTLAEDAYSTTIVNEVLRTRETLLTNNAQFDQNYEVGQSIIMRGLRAILCAPMMVKDRIAGIVYVDTSMRSGTFTEADRDLLDLVAGQAAITLENAYLYSVAVEKGRMERELQMAREIQQGLLPSKLPQLAGYQIAAHWEAAREVAGDFYDAFMLGPDGFAIVIADVSDKGAPAALFMAVARTMIRTLAYGGSPPVETLRQTNDLMLEDADSGMFVTVYHSVFQRDGSGTHVNAGHNPPLIYRQARGEVESLPRGGRAIGWFPDNPLTPLEQTLAPGDVIVYYTDGISEAENAAGEQFGLDRLVEVVAQNAESSAEALLKRISQAVERFVDGAAAYDDMTLVVVRFTGV